MRYLLGFVILICTLTVAVAVGLVLGSTQIILEEVWVMLTG